MVEGSLKAGARLFLPQLNEFLSGGSQGSCSELISAARLQGPFLPSGVGAMDTFSVPSGTTMRTTPLMAFAAERSNNTFVVSVKAGGAFIACYCTWLPDAQCTAATQRNL